MAKARGNVTRTFMPQPGYRKVCLPEKIEISAWCPDADGKAPPEQVHFAIHLTGLDAPLLMRFKSPDTLGFFIEELARYRQAVWPEAEPVKVV
jgi:hypothetical protein